MSDLLIGKLIQLAPGFIVVPFIAMGHGNYDCVVVHNTNPGFKCYPVGGFNISCSLDRLVGPPVLDLGKLIGDTRPAVVADPPETRPF